MAEMEDDLVRRYNEKVSPEDHVLFCGDIFFRCPSSEYERIIGRLNGRKSLVIGNHDPSPTVMRLLGFETVDHILRFDIEGVPCVVCHYPYAASESYMRENGIKDKYAKLRPPKQQGTVLIHGHTHSLEKAKVAYSSVHVGVDAWGLGPAPIQEVAVLVKEIQASWR